MRCEYFIAIERASQDNLCLPYNQRSSVHWELFGRSGLTSYMDLVSRFWKIWNQNKFKDQLWVYCAQVCNSAFLGGVPEGSHTSTISVFRLSVHPSVRPSVTGICYRKYLHVSVTENTSLLCYRNYCLALLQKIPTLTCYRNLYSHHKKIL